MSYSQIPDLFYSSSVFHSEIYTQFWVFCDACVSLATSHCPSICFYSALCVVLVLNSQLVQSRACMSFCKLQAFAIFLEAVFRLFSNYFCWEQNETEEKWKCSNFSHAFIFSNFSNARVLLNLSFLTFLMREYYLIYSNTPCSCLYLSVNRSGNANENGNHILIPSYLTFRYEKLHVLSQKMKKIYEDKLEKWVYFWLWERLCVCVFIPLITGSNYLEPTPSFCPSCSLSHLKKIFLERKPLLSG